MSEAILEQGELTTEQAEAQIREVFQEISLMGANDSEHDQIEEIVANMKIGITEPAEAVELAKKVLYSKNDYH